YPGAPLKRLQVSIDGTEIVQRGVLHKGVDIPFEIRAQLDITRDGLVRLHPTRTKILGVNGGGLMRALGLSLEKLIDLSKAKGASVHGNDLFLDANLILPPPAMDGRATAIRVDGDEIVQEFGTRAELSAMKTLAPPDRSAPSYMYFRGGQLRFGKLLMLDAEMQIVSLEASVPFAFDLDRYNAQLVAGYSRTLPDLGLEAYMRDVTRLGDHRATQVTLR
ncbi:MAG TPA: hypothetical protein VGT98_09635, partial [Candidatus Elarobacter sp.]|nr:hypothetical protein [Candidatus Elarobacter sp.]